MKNYKSTELLGKFHNNQYLPNNTMGRTTYINEVRKNAEKTNYSLFVKIDEPYLFHLDRQFTINYYFKDWERIIPIMKEFYGEGNFYVVNGFRSPYELGDTIHSSGLAMDILVKNEEDAERLMNAAYMAGIPTIIPAGDIAGGQGHIHLDLARKASFTYNAGTYNGPWGNR